MQIVLTERFQHDVRSLREDWRNALFEVLLLLPRAVGRLPLHAGLGLRKVHQSGIWEARLGLGLRLLFSLESDRLTLVRVGNHDDVRRFLRDL